MQSEEGAPKALWCILYILLVLLFVLAKASLYSLVVYCWGREPGHNRIIFLMTSFLPLWS